MADNFESESKAVPESGIDDESARDEGDEVSDSDDEKLLEDAKARFELAKEAETEIRRLALEDIDFSAGNQWDQASKIERERDNRPCLVVNRIPQFVQQVANDQRQNRPAIKVHPVDDAADVETAKIIQGLIRHIEYNSNAEAAYDTAFESAVRGGFGYFRITTDYADPDSFDQEILIKRIKNPFTVYFDPRSQEPDGSDAAFAFVEETLSAEDFRAQYPNAKLSSDSDWESIGDQAPGWATKDSARVVEYFYKEFEEKNLCLLSSGEVCLKEEAEQVLTIKAMQGAPAQVLKERKTRVPVVRWCKITATEVLERTEFPVPFIPILPVYGQDLDINGKRVLEGIVRHAKDPQRMLNYWKSAHTEALALAPRTPFVAAEGQIEGHEEEWASANRKNYSVLLYKPVALNGQPMPPPQRMAIEPAVQGFVQATMQAADDLKATTGIYDSSLGAQSNETSGIAIQRRNVQSQTSNFHFVDNLTRSMKHAGRILVALIPKIYDTARTARIIGDDGEQKVVPINQPTGEMGKDGQPLIYDLSVGKYDVTVDVGPSFASKRQEAAASMMDFTKSNPQSMPLIGDLIVKNMDWPGAQEIAERLKKMLPPQLQEQGKGQPQVPPQVQAQMQHMGQMVDALTKELHAAHDVLDKKRIEIESRERIEMAKLQVEVELGMAKIGSSESIELLKHEIAAIENRLSLLHMAQPLDGGSMPMPGGAPQPQDLSPPMDPSGGEPAPQGQQGVPLPTGGPSPGQPVEGQP